MMLFKKKEKASCCCADGCQADTMRTAEALKKSKGIKILGSGCAKCNELETVVKAALLEKGLHQEIEHITDFALIAAYGVMTTPALVIDGKVVSYGKVLKKEEILDILDREQK